ncbi:shikimate kinase [soil metagenome]
MNPAVQTDSPQPTRAPGRLRNIVLIGFMGVGKSTVGRRIAESLGFLFVDTDAEIVRASGKAIPEIFAERGEAGFRALESATLRALASLGQSGMVIATGGGVVTVDANRPLLRGLGFVVWLNADEETIYRRVRANTERPLVRTRNPRKTIHDLLAVRRPVYAKTAHMKVDTDSLTTEEISVGVSESARHHFATPR